MKPLQFNDIEGRIKAALEPRLTPQYYPREVSGFTLVDKFLLPSLQSEIGSGISLGGPALPMIAVVGNSTGQVYLFAVKVLLPDVELQ